MNIPIENKEFKKYGNVVRIDVSIVPHKRAVVKVCIYSAPAEPINDVDTEILLNEIMIVEGEDYDKWGEDDSYLENLVLSKYGLVKKV